MNMIITDEACNKLSANRTSLMGVGIILVLIFHLGCSGFSLLGGRFNIGYCGVDIFMICSGFGLCYSYVKSSLKQFYCKRFIRIMPLWIITVVIYSIMMNRGGDYILSEITTIQLYINGGSEAFEWYISSIILLYILFPLLYKVKSSQWSLLLIIGGIMTLYLFQKYIYSFVIDGMILMFISRIPCFMFGIMLYKSTMQKVNILLGFVLLLCIPVWVFKQYLGVDMLIIGLMILYLSSSVKINNKVICWLGKYSLEIYLSNIIWMTSNKVLAFNHDTEVLLSFLILHPVLTLLFIYINKQVQNFLKNALRN